ncbi:MAG TPA: hypothetical protein PKC13_10170 [Blastocatellia bacterium]|nr:hypothetical protein [Blastocatellia bacterium]HMX25955.1 hypothetical protein [Blastocatellia bacterium]HMY73292.1 hypothetical protein [Blastocatellia bacterium]
MQRLLVVVCGAGRETQLPRAGNQTKLPAGQGLKTGCGCGCGGRQLFRVRTARFFLGGQQQLDDFVANRPVVFTFSAWAEVWKTSARNITTPKSFNPFMTETSLP